MRLLFPGGRWTELALESTAVRSITHRIASRGLTPAPEQRVLLCSALHCSHCTAATATATASGFGAQSSRQRAPAAAAAAMAGDSCGATLTARRCVPLLYSPAGSPEVREVRGTHHLCAYVCSALPCSALLCPALPT